MEEINEKELLEINKKNKLKNKKSKEETIRSFFGENLSIIRESKNLTQKQVADKLYIAVSTYANWEQGRRDPSIEDIVNIVNVLEIDYNELFDFNITEILKRNIAKK